jgi:hydrogenase expression/formation protein HypC
MCLGVPGEILRDYRDAAGWRLGTVRFGGVEREVSLACVPEARVGDFVIVHVGVAISTLSPAAAREVFGYLEQIEALGEPRAEPAP